MAVYENVVDFQMDSVRELEWSEYKVDLGQEVENDAPIGYDNGNGSESEGCLSEYKSNGDDEPLDSNSEYETPMTKMARVVKKNAYKGQSDGLESLVVCQVFDNVNHFERVLENYAI